MALRMLRVGTAIGLTASGVLMIAASWQRWAPCAHGDTAPCDRLQDHLYDFLPPARPWEPVGRAAELGGLSLMVLAFVLVLLPWALTGRRPGRLSLVALVAAVPAVGAVGLATLRSGLSGEVVAASPTGWTTVVWLVVPPVLLGRWAVAARGWARAAAILLVLAMPLVAYFSYAIGPYDTQPWWEAISGGFAVVSALCLAMAAATSPAELAQPRVADPEVVPDLVDHRPPDLLHDV